MHHQFSFNSSPVTITKIQRFNWNFEQFEFQENCQYFSNNEDRQSLFFQNRGSNFFIFFVTLRGSYEIFVFFFSAPIDLKFSQNM